MPPWCELLPETTILFIRHRLARVTSSQIARRYGVSRNTVRGRFSRAANTLRQRSGLPLHGEADLLVLAAQDRLAPAPL